VVKIIVVVKTIIYVENLYIFVIVHALFTSAFFGLLWNKMWSSKLKIGKSNSAIE